MVEVLHKGVYYPQPSEEETKEAVEQLMNELNGMVDQATQTPPAKPSLEDAFNSKVKLVGVYDSPDTFSKAMWTIKERSTGRCITVLPFVVILRFGIITTWLALVIKFVWKSACPKMGGSM